MVITYHVLSKATQKTKSGDLRKPERNMEKIIYNKFRYFGKEQSNKTSVTVTRIIYLFLLHLFKRNHNTSCGPRVISFRTEITMEIGST